MPYEQSPGCTITGWQCSGDDSRPYFDALRTMAAPVLLHAWRLDIPGGVDLGEYHDTDARLTIHTTEHVSLDVRMSASDLSVLSRAIRTSDERGAPVTVRKIGDVCVLDVGDTCAWDDACHEDVAAARARYAGATAAARAVLQATIAAAAIVEAQEVAAAVERCADRKKE